MKIEQYRPVDIEDVANVPENSQWVEEYMAPVHEQLRKLTLILQSNVGIDNLAAESRTVTMRSGREVAIDLTTLKGRPYGAVAVAADSLVTAFTAQPTDVGKIALTGTFADTDRDVEVKVLIFGG